MNILSALGGGLFIIPLGLFLASGWSFYRGFKQWTSGSAGYQGNAWIESKDRVPFFSIGAVIFGLIFLAASVGSLLWMIAEK